ncbi:MULTISPECIES: class I SAM-dependent methyltransferase [unclassified Bradyrhizobium]|uniref:class I SAM-dependent methyltransferase n=1 Tax=unclassified Bradyrhizobium TaxID=2631580 RepID=UPI002479ACDC|nr:MULTISPECIES: class I SAM-dependent methyltransferase [unclassified Bradyrhizobium]WGS21533.1 class I SAM-dependent methyltransferase [Bradyrhizobium sp. ISRA463]WGS28469.1 class I SAM-dependent methyltransferase [Bradyrhizobium sp. ISRA464]
MRAFGRPQGLLGRLGGAIMARMNAECGAWVVELLEVEPDDRVLEVGFGPGAAMQHLSGLVSAGSIAGVDPSAEMVEQARSRNAAAVRSGRVDLQLGSVERLPFGDNSFDKALAINSMQVWPVAIAGLREISRVLKPGGRIALGFTAYSGQPNEGLAEKLTSAGFAKASVIKTGGFVPWP